MALGTWMRQIAVKYMEGMAQAAKEYHRQEWSSFPGEEELAAPKPPVPKSRPDLPME